MDSPVDGDDLVGDVGVPQDRERKIGDLGGLPEESQWDLLT